MKIQTQYDLGINKLMKLLGNEHPQFTTLLTLQNRIFENIESYRRLGDTERIKTERIEILESLNSLALETVGVSFNDLAQLSFLTIGEEPAIQQAIDYGTRIPEISAFYGREEELLELESLIVNRRMKVIGLFGIAGVGKTALSTVLLKRIQNKFDYVIWHSFLNAPLIEDVLRESIGVISHHQDTLQFNLESDISKLLFYLAKHRCLIVFDNFESIFQAGGSVGEYLPGYENYGYLLKKLIGMQHQSCILITSREKPKEFLAEEDQKSLIRSLTLKGLNISDAKEILINKKLTANSTELEDFIEKYSGNPLALKLISETIHDAFGGNISTFLLQDSSISIDISDVLDGQFNRLSTFEREIIYWLAIERESVSISELHSDTEHLMGEKRLLDSLLSLRRRSLVDITSEGFALPNVVMEYITDNLIERISQEIKTEGLNLLATHALIKAQSKEHVRNSQVRLILRPISELLLGSLKKHGVENILSNILLSIQKQNSSRHYYAAGNIINMLVQLEIDLSGKDFSNLDVWQAYLRKVPLRDTDFSASDLSGTVFAETFGNILSVEFVDRKSLAASTANGEIVLWELDRLMRLSTIRGHNDWVRYIAVSPDQKTLISCCDDNTIKVWDVAKGSLVKTLLGHSGWVLSAAYSPDGQKLVTGDGDGLIKVWNRTGDNVLNIKGHTNWIRSISFHPDGAIFATSSEDLTIKFWNANTGAEIKAWTGFKSNITSTKFSPDGTKLAVGCYDELGIYDVETGKKIHDLVGHTHRVLALDYSHNGEFIASCGQDQTIRVWNTDEGICIKVFQGHTAKIWTVRFSSNDKELVSGSDDQSIRIWETESGKCNFVLRGYTNWTRSVIFSPEGDKIISHSDDKSIRFWDVKSGECVQILPEYGNSVGQLAITSNGEILAIPRDDFSIMLLGLRKENNKILAGYSNRLRPLTISSDNNLIASAGEAPEIWLWNLDTGELNCQLKGHGSWIRSLSISQDGKLLASCSEDKTIKIWDIQKQECVKTFAEGILTWSLALSPSNNMLISAGEDQLVKYWDIRTGESIKELSGHSAPIYACRISKSGRYIATGSFDNTARIWDLQSGVCLHILEGHDGWVWALDFNKDDTQIVTGSADETIKVWDIETGKCLRTIHIERPYERMNITQVTGISDAQKELLIQLGAYVKKKNSNEERASL